jgi:hypothetical protein
MIMKALFVFALDDCALILAATGSAAAAALAAAERFHNCRRFSSLINRGQRILNEAVGIYHPDALFP